MLIMIKYRADIDGLRAIAVLLVFAYHLKISVFSGGFVGVDVFFVISGYLITGIILNPIAEKRFSLLSFFNRRIKRIIPSVAVVSTATVIVSYFILLPSDFNELIRSYLYTSLYSANIFFQSVTSGYFSPSSDELPLLHMWSLSVEEQYYFIWPLMLLMVFKLSNKKSLGVITLLLAIISFAIAEITSLENQSFSYYMLPTRAGGLLIGSALAIMQKDNDSIRNYNSKYTVLIGLILIFGSSIYIDTNNTFPGILSAIPSLGAFFVILGGSGYKNNLISKILSLKPVVTLGLLSFGIYLWHWPIIALINYLSITITYKVIFFIFTLTVSLSALSMIFLENPIRKSKLTFKSSFIILNLAFVLIGLILLIISQVTNGFSYRFNGDDLTLNRVNVSYADLDAGWCHVSSEKTNDIKFNSSLSNCFIGDKSSNNTALFIGDSTAGHYGPFIDKLAKDARIKVRQLSTSSCYPSVNIKKNGENPDVCFNFRKIIKESIDSHKYDIVILSNRWVRDSADSSYKTSYISDTISYFSNNSKVVIILGQLPEWEIDPALCIKRKTCSPSSDFKLSSDIDAVMNDIKKVAKSKDNVIIIDPSYLLKVNGKYTPFAMGYPMYHDRGHLSIKGMEWLSEKFISENKNQLK
ncbi:TPA: acyltransferase [Morganella morganii]|nr:acyltransferase [Morganella morganii]